MLRCRVDMAQPFQRGVVRAIALCIRSLYMEVFQGEEVTKEEVPCRSDRHEVRREMARALWRHAAADPDSVEVPGGLSKQTWHSNVHAATAAINCTCRLWSHEPVRRLASM